MLDNVKRKLLGDALPCYVISRQPLILVSYWQDFYQRREQFSAACRNDEPIYVLAMLGWHRETAARADELRDDILRVRQLDPRFEPIILANSPDEQILLAARRVRAVFCHQNAFLDERRYNVDPRARKRHDALYVARITPFKRHALAGAIDSLRLVGSWHESERAYRDETLRQLSHASWRKKIPSPWISREMNAAHCGLCLSAEEGAMFVSAEYLLCGLPVVSTPNLGGRDQLFPADFALTVEPEPAAVAAGVAQQVARRFDPRDIREATLARMAPHREALVNLLQTIYDSEGVSRDAAAEWPTTFRHKMGIRCRVPPQVRITRGLFATSPLLRTRSMTSLQKAC